MTATSNKKTGPLSRTSVVWRCPVWATRPSLSSGSLRREHWRTILKAREGRYLIRTGVSNVNVVRVQLVVLVILRPLLLFKLTIGPCNIPSLARFFGRNGFEFILWLISDLHEVALKRCLSYRCKFPRCCNNVRILFFLQPGVSLASLFELYSIRTFTVKLLAPCRFFSSPKSLARLM